jgi:predicted O-methyltransferase YrrM
MRRVTAAVAHNRQLIGLPPKVALFYARSRRLARRRHDEWSLHSSTKPADLRELIRIAKGRREVVEIGTGTAWTSAALALADRKRTITTFDPIVRGEREWYIGLAGIPVRKRVTFESADGEAGAEDYDGRPSLLYIDGSHERERTIGTFMAWRPKLAPGAIVAFHDYSNPVYPGVREAIGELGLNGEVIGEFYVWKAG